MRTASAIYKMVRALGDSWYDFRIVRGSTIYGRDKIKSLTANPSLTNGNGVSIGGANATECRITLIEQSTNWERMAKFTVEFRILSRGGGTASEWIKFGTFYTDERSEDNHGNLSIVAFDGMLKMEQTWSDKIPSALLPSSYPITARTWATMIEGAEIAEFYDLSQLDNTVQFIGLNTTSSVRDVLKTIASAHGGNWVMVTTVSNGVASEKLKLIQFENAVGNPAQTIGTSLKGFENSPQLAPVTKVHLETASGTAVEAGTNSGYMISAECDFSDSDGVADLCLSRISQYVYKPFTATNAYLDPIIELGDYISINETQYHVMAIDWNFNTMPVAKVSAPFDQEVDHEYTILNPTTKTYRKAMSLVEEQMDDYLPKAEFSTALIQNEQAITQIASATFVTQEDFDEQIAEIQGQIDGSIQTWSGNVVPTLNNAPAVDWNTPSLKAEHVGDTYFVNSDAGIPEAGQYYRFENNNGVYSWQILNDSVLSEALAKAAAALAAAEDAQDSAEASLTEAQAKGRIFVVPPTPPYNVGDLWFNNTESVIKVCMTARAEGEQYNLNTDWVKRDNYADYNELDAWLAQYSTAFQNLMNQVDQKAETYYQATDPSADWDFVHPVGIAVVGIDVVGYSRAAGLKHEGDLWYRTTDGTTWYFDSEKWVQQDVPDEVFDKIDGKAQIFVVTPYPPYNVGDLWFNGTDSDIMTCTTKRDSGSYVASDWVKYNKYTDDTAANAVGYALTQFQSEFTVQPNQIKAEVEKRVIKDKSETKTTFGWLLNETSHTWYSGNQEVMKVDRNGLSVTGNITAKTGYIGNGSSGFTIDSTKFYNGKSSMTSTASGVYVGTNGIALGAYNSTSGSSAFQVTSAGVITARSGTVGGFTLSDSSLYNGKSSMTSTSSGVYIGTTGIALGAYDSTNRNSAFQVTSAGVLTARSGTVGGFTISNSAIYTNNQNSYSGTGSGIYIGSSGLRIGSKFSVDNEGNLRAAGASFEGNIYAKNILYSQSDSSIGTLSGEGITRGSITGGVNSSGIATGAIAPSTVAVANTVGMSSSLAYADRFGLAINSGTVVYPAYFTCGALTAKDGITSNGNILASSSTIQGKTVQGSTIKVYYGSSSTGSYYDISNHTHSIKEVSGGKLSVDKPDWTGADHPFDIADTTKYKTDVLASRAVLYCNASNYSDFSSGYDCDVTGSSYHYSPSGANYEYARVDLRNSYGNSLKTVRIKMPKSTEDVYINGALGLTTTSSTYTTYDRAVSFAASSAYTSGSTQYVRVNVTLSNGESEIIRVGTSASSSSSVARVVLGNYGSSAVVFPYYYQNAAGTYGSIKAVAQDSSGNELRSDDLDVTELIQYVYNAGGGGGGGGGGDKSINMYCVKRTENSAGLVTCDFSVSSYNGLFWQQGNYYTFYYN